MIILGIELNGPILLAGIAWICAAGWIVFAAVAVYELARQKPMFLAEPAQPTTNLPFVSILIPSRNEAGRILAQSVRSVLAQDYEELEVIVVNDRSTDTTESILRSIAAEDKRLRVINGVEPPAGWLGEFGAVRADALEDVRLAGLLKSSGGRFHIGHAPNLARTRMHYNFREIWNYLSRCMFAAMGYSFLFSALYILTGYAFVVAPPLVAALCVLMFGAGWSNEWSSVLLVPCLTIWGIQVAALICMCKKDDVPWRYALSTPLGLSLFYTALLVSTIKILRGKGVIWKDRRVYDSAAT